MPRVKPDEINRLYYSKRHIAAELGVPQSTLTYWESFFGDRFFAKKAKGVRRYDEKSLLLFKRVYTLLKIDKFTLQGAKQKLNRRSC